MLVRFHTYDEACLFCAVKREDGYFAEVIHDNFGHCYGHMASNGFAVIVSDEAAPEGVTVPVSEPEEARVSEVGKMVAMLGLLGMLGGLLLGLYTLARIAVKFTKSPDSLQLQFFVFIALLFLFLWVILKVTRVYNRPQHRLYGFSRFIMKLIAWLIILMYLPEVIGFVLYVVFLFNGIL